MGGLRQMVSRNCAARISVEWGYDVHTALTRGNWSKVNFGSDRKAIPKMGFNVSWNFAGGLQGASVVEYGSDGAALAGTLSDGTIEICPMSKPDWAWPADLSGVKR